MSTTYTYTGKASAELCNCALEVCNSIPPCKVCISGLAIHKEVEDSAMGDKTLEYCVFIKDTGVLTITFTNALGAGDKTILDGIVASNTTDV